MSAYIVRRLISSSITILLLSFTIFAFMETLSATACNLNEKYPNPNCPNFPHLNQHFGWRYVSYLVGDDTVEGQLYCGNR